MGTLGMILSFVGGIGMLIFGILILIQAFKTSIGWGLASLLIPFVVFVYVAKNWEATKTNFLRWAASFVVWGIGFAISAMGAFSAAGG
ncbi:MAG: hypothetical protein KDB94_10905 [Acidobacteria bacterium]|nr:hypothetical protein [Acidobacteriota bacterium]MCB9379018.1 hypothetical protein [Holophagales bacterium]